MLILQIFILIIFETSEDDLKYFDTTLIHDTTVLDDLRKCMIIYTSSKQI